MSLKGTFFDSFTPATAKTDEELEETKKAANEEGSDLVDDETAKLAAEAEYGDESEFEEDTEKKVDSEEEDEPVVKTPSKKETTDEEAEDLEEGNYTEFINGLAEEGVVYYDPEKEYSTGTAGVIEVIEDTVERKKQEWIEEIPEDYHSLILALKAGKPLADWIEAKNPENLVDADLTDIDTQKALVERQMRAQEFDEDEITERLESLEDSGTLDKEAKLAQKFLIKQQKKAEKEYDARLAQEIAEREEAEELAKDTLKESIYKVKDLGGFKLDKKRQEQLFDHITKKVGKTGKTQLQLNQTSFDKQLLAAYLDMIDYKFEDLKKAATTTVSKGLRNALSNLTTDPNAKRGGKTITETRASIKVPKGVWDANREVED